MEKIILERIIKDNNCITYGYSVSEGLKMYFTGEPYYVEYRESIEEIPYGIAVIPFLMNILQISWITDCEVCIEEIDKMFFASIPKLKKAFSEMYPEITFNGTLTVKKITENVLQGKGKSALFYSGGLDSAVSLVRHITERPYLISIWGSDVEHTNQEGWRIVEEEIKKIADENDLEHCVVRSSFRKFDDSIQLTKVFGDLLQTTWWYGIKHGMGIIGHAVPLAWLHGIENIYIASSNCPSDGVQRCASDPTIDNCIRFSSCSVHHDAFELTRQEKTECLVSYSKENKPISLHVCWKSDTGKNCCMCEKCFRTMVGIWIAGDDPLKYGFTYDDSVFDRIYDLIALRYKGLPGHTWTYMKNAFIESYDSLPAAISEGLNWMKTFDFLDEEANDCRIQYRKSWKWKNKIIKYFPRFYKFYIKMRGYRFE